MCVGGDEDSDAGGMVSRNVTSCVVAGELRGHLIQDINDLPSIAAEVDHVTVLDRLVQSTHKNMMFRSATHVGAAEEVDGLAPEDVSAPCLEYAHYTAGWENTTPGELLTLIAGKIPRQVSSKPERGSGALVLRWRRTSRRGSPGRKRPERMNGTGKNTRSNNRSQDSNYNYIVVREQPNLLSYSSTYLTRVLLKEMRYS